MLPPTHLMDAGYATFQDWAANLRDRYPADHPLGKNATYLCHALHAWHTSWLFQRSPNSAKNLTRPLEERIASLVKELHRLGAAPPTEPNSTGAASHS